MSEADGVDDRTSGVAGDGGETRTALERRHFAVADALPLIGVALVTAVRRVHAHQDVGLGNLGPERVELGQRRRTRSLEAPDRGRANQDDFGTTLEHPVELTARLVDDAEVDHRRGEHPVVVVEGPVLGHPLVECVDNGVDGARVVVHPLLQEAGQGRPDEGPVDAQLVEELDAGLGVTVAGVGPHALAQGLPAGLTLRVALLEVLLLGAGGSHDLERGVRDVVADLVVDGDLGASIQPART